MKARLPPRFREATMTSLDKKSFPMVQSWKADSPKGLMLSGPPGVGKTFALAALTRWYAEVAGNDTEFVTAPDLFDNYSVFEDATKIDEYRNQSYSRTYQTIPFLVINDLGKEYRGGDLGKQVAYKLGRILRMRSENNLITHVTTNVVLQARDRGAESLSTVYGDSITSLLFESVQGYEIVGPDLRRKPTTV